MPLSAGTRLGPYEVLAAIGAGGMGEVYKARDTRLDRIVAIKVLPPQLAGDPEFRERFEREARILSQLDHPHICPVYDVGQERPRPARGASLRDAKRDASGGGVPASSEEDGIDFLVMQYLEGETLFDRLANGALPIAQGKLKKIDATGGPPQTVANAGTVANGGTWNSDGTIVFASSANGGLSRVAAAGGAATPATMLDAAQKEQWHRPARRTRAARQLPRHRPVPGW